jgi:hydroxyacylglutathione hydrolase
VLILDQDRYVTELLAGLDAYPAHYAHRGPANAAGPSQPDLTMPHRADAAELRRRIAAGEWVVDLRARRAFAAEHLPGTLSFDLDGSFATYLGWLIPWGTPLTLLGHTPEQIAEAQRELTRIGFDRPAAAAVGHPDEWAAGRALRGYPVADFADLEAVRRHRDVVILDVRRDSEWAASHVAGAVHIPIHQLPSRLADVPEGEVWVHCEAGYRASVAASVLDAVGRAVVAVDDEYARAAVAGLPAEGYLAHAAAK